MRLEDAALDLAPEDGARRLVGALLDQAIDAAADLAAGAGAEPLHDFRVALRRLRSALRTFAPWLGGAVRRRHVRRLAALGRATSAPRDAEVQLAWLATQRRAIASPSRLPGHAAAVAWFEARRRAGPAPAAIARRLRRVARKLQRRLGRAAGADGRAGTGAAGGETLGHVLAGLVVARAGALAGRIAAIRDAADLEGAHRARIEVKRLRDLLEPLRGSRRADATEVVLALKALQDVLGGLHDAHVLAEALGDALAEVSSDRARRVEAAVLAVPPRRAADALRGSPRAGLLALLRLVVARREALYASLESARRGGGLECLAVRARALAGALAAEGSAPPDGRGRATRARGVREDEAIANHPPALRRPRCGSSGGGCPSRAP